MKNNVPQMSPGSTSLYGFLYQMMLSLFAAFHTTIELKGWLQLPKGGDLPGNLAPDTSEVASALQKGTVIVRVALEGHSDIDIHRSGHIEYVQAKAHPKSRQTWTIVDLFREVLQKLPDTRKETLRFRYHLVTDTGFNSACERLLAFCKWLDRISAHLEPTASDIEWEELLRTARDGDQEIVFPKSELWGNHQLRCTFREIPQYLTKFKALRKQPKPAEL